MTDDSFTAVGGIGAPRKPAQHRYGYVRYPWRAIVDLASPRPAAFYADMIGQALRYGLPARRRPGFLWALAGRRGIPERTLASSLRLLPRRAAPEIDELLEQVKTAWPSLAGRSSRLPSAPGPIAGLALARSAALTLFVFGEPPEPLLVVKVPHARDARVETESTALEEAEPANVAPRYLGRVGNSHVQEGMPGRALRVEPVTPRTASGLHWREPLQELADGLTRLASTTAKRQFADEIRPAIEYALASSALREQTKEIVAAAWRDVGRVDVSVLRHHDTSPQNCLFSDGRLSAIVDWEMAVSRGAPAFDVWNAALAYMEFGVGLTRWSEELVVQTFASAWTRSEYWIAARGAARAAAAAAGVPDRALDALEVVFFASRVGDRLRRPGWHPTGPSTAAEMLEVVIRD